jgi:hypothetical protein
MSSSLSASDRSAGPILAAHPQVRDIPIRVFFFMKNMSISFQRPQPLLQKGRVRRLRRFFLTHL